MTKELKGINPIWHQVRLLRPALPQHAEIIQQEWRGESWYVVQDRLTGNFHRFPEAVSYILGLMNGQLSIEDIWMLARSEKGNAAPDQNDLITLLSQLYHADLLRNIKDKNAALFGERRAQYRRSARMGRLMNPIALRFHLFDPDRFIERILPYVGWLFSPAGLVLWWGLILAALIQAGLHWSELTGGLSDRLLSADNLLIMFLVFPMVKAWHEIGHAVAVKKFGGEVHEIGLLLLAFMPLPFTDTSFSAAFPNKWHRAAVGAGGMLFELVLAAFAMFIWAEVEAGWLSAICFNIMVLATISTLLFNLNPLIKLDGYYIFSDLLGLPSLAKRSAEIIRWWVCKYVFGMEKAAKPYWVEGELKWLVLYGVISPFYRLFVMLMIAMFIAERFFIFGTILALISIVMIAGLPMVKFLNFLIRGTTLKGHRVRALFSSSVIIAGLVGFVLFVPMPYWTSGLGVIMAPSEAMVRSDGTGLIQTVAKKNGVPVQEGEVLVTLEDPYLHQMRDRLEREIDEYQNQYQAQRYKDAVKAAIILEEMKLIKSQLDLVETRLVDLQVKANREGYFLTLVNPEDTVGSYLNKGTHIGYVVQRGELFVQAIVAQEKIEPVRNRLRSVDLMIVEGTPHKFQSDVLREHPRATKRLPSLALSTVGGGDLSLDPEKQKDLSGQGRPEPYAYQEQFLFDLTLPVDLEAEVPRIGQRVYVRFHHDPEPLGPRLYRLIRQTFLERLNI